VQSTKPFSICIACSSKLDNVDAVGIIFGERMRLHRQWAHLFFYYFYCSIHVRLTARNVLLKLGVNGRNRWFTPAEGQFLILLLELLFLSQKLMHGGCGSSLKNSLMTGLLRINNVRNPFLFNKSGIKLCKLMSCYIKVTMLWSKFNT
jgi:hypothetical protein